VISFSVKQFLNPLIFRIWQKIVEFDDEIGRVISGISFAFVRHFLALVLTAGTEEEAEGNKPNPRCFYTLSHWKTILKAKKDKNVNSEHKKRFFQMLRKKTNYLMLSSKAVYADDKIPKLIYNLTFNFEKYTIYKNF
jgi:hypothetical protein